MNTTLTRPEEQAVAPDKHDTARLSQCHWISNTHWDREWRYSMQRTRHMLVYMIPHGFADDSNAGLS